MGEGGRDGGGVVRDRQKGAWLEGGVADHIRQKNPPPPQLSFNTQIFLVVTLMAALVNLKKKYK